ncbi:MAG: zinc-ribbon domain-containing protein [Pseudolysinimonas sp.]|uniref:zinc-ribbon domain-containing protein n=1 Tax=Pseudolysinimonas sp. TaxID=2680009 RepID=UPI003265101B
MIIFGTRTSSIALAVISFLCGFCKVQAAQRIFKRVTKFTLFFIPLFPVSTRYFVTCVNCGGTTEINKQQVDHYQEFIDNQRIERDLDERLEAN